MPVDLSRPSSPVLPTSSRLDDVFTSCAEQAARLAVNKTADYLVHEAMLQ